MDEAEKERLLAEKKGLDTNRYLAMALCVLLIYWIFIKQGDSPKTLPYYVIMCALLLVAAALAVRDTILIGRINKKLKGYGRDSNGE